MAVPPVSNDDFGTRHGRDATGRGGRTATSSSTSYGTTSNRAAATATGQAPERQSSRHPLAFARLQCALVNIVAILIWLFSGAHGDFWPRWVLLVTLITFTRRALGLGAAPYRHVHLDSAQL